MDEEPICMNSVLVSRCSWAANSNNPEMQLYHDTEWGVPVHNDTKLFEFIVLESAQAGLNWATILRKRLDYRKAFVNYDVKKVAEFGMPHVELTLPLLMPEHLSRYRMTLVALIITFGTLLKAEESNITFS
jgi:DNA-3-methyladenine glycosylase I